jgi:hypothetical protein
MPEPIETLPWQCRYPEKNCHLDCREWQNCENSEKKSTVRSCWSATLTISSCLMFYALAFYLLSQRFTDDQLLDFTIDYLLPIGGLLFLVWIIFRKQR